jgi:hypothetical protein
MCEGKGKHAWGRGGKAATCIHCKGTGVCRYCGGTGDADSEVGKDLWYGRKDIADVGRMGCFGRLFLILRNTLVGTVIGAVVGAAVAAASDGNPGILVQLGAFAGSGIGFVSGFRARRKR